MNARLKYILTKRSFGALIKVLRGDVCVYPELLQHSLGERILVLSPHPDDDVIGAGGAIAKSVRARKAVKIAYLTDGASGQSDVERRRMVSIRRDEAARAAARLSVHDLVFLDHPADTSLDCETMAEKLRSLVGAFRPDTVYLPFFFDNHPEHRQASQLLCRLRGHDGLRVCAYEIWSPAPITHVLDISDVFEDKMASIREHRSQLADIAYDAKIAGLNAYRSLTVGKGVTYAEGFFVASLGDYAKMAKAMQSAKGWIR